MSKPVAKRSRKTRTKSPSVAAPIASTNATSEATTNGASAASAPAGSGAALVLGAECTIHQAEALQAELLAAAQRPGTCMLDAGAVQRIDTAGLQLLVGFTLDCMERGTAFGWAARSVELDRAAQLIGVSALLESPGIPA